MNSESHRFELRWCAIDRRKIFLLRALEKRNGAQEARRAERRVGFVGVCDGEGDGRCAGLLVADEAIDPQVGDTDFNGA